MVLLIDGRVTDWILKRLLKCREISIEIFTHKIRTKQTVFTLRSACNFDRSLVHVSSYPWKYLSAEEIITYDLTKRCLCLLRYSICNCVIYTFKSDEPDSETPFGISPSGTGNGGFALLFRISLKFVWIEKLRNRLLNFVCYCTKKIGSKIRIYIYTHKVKFSLCTPWRKGVYLHAVLRQAVAGRPLLLLCGYFTAVSEWVENRTSLRGLRNDQFYLPGFEPRIIQPIWDTLIRTKCNEWHKTHTLTWKCLSFVWENSLYQSLRKPLFQVHNT